MAVVSPFSSKLKAQLKLAINRLRLLQTKEIALAKQNRRNMAQLLELGKEESARIRVENIIRADIHVELLEILELYCELLLARIGILDNAAGDLETTGLEEATNSLVFAAPHTEVKELNNIKELLIARFGKEFALAAMEGQHVSEKVTKRVSNDPPKAELVNLYLCEIAKAYEVPFSGLNEDAVDPNDSDSDDDPSGGQLVPPIALQEKSTQIQSPVRRLSGVADLPHPGAEPKSPISVSTPTPSTDNPRPTVKLPRKDTSKQASSSDKEFDALKSRFEALRRS